jgi:O-methyltransferase
MANPIWILRCALSRNADRRFEALITIGRWLFPAYRFKWPQMAWWDDERFNAYLGRFNERSGMNDDRRWMVYQLLRLVRNVPGDTAECGVFHGAGSYLICSFNRTDKSHERIHHLFDSFEGLSAPSVDDGTHWEKGAMACGIDVVRQNLREFSDVQYHQGWIPERFPEVADRKFAFVHIDVDLYEPTRDSIEFFYPRMNPGGIIICDDYGFTNCPAATKAIDEYLADKPERMLPLSSGGGFFIKGSPVSGDFLPDK